MALKVKWHSNQIGKGKILKRPTDRIFFRDTEMKKLRKLFYDVMSF